MVNGGNRPSFYVCPHIFAIVSAALRLVPRMEKVGSSHDERPLTMLAVANHDDLRMIYSTTPLPLHTTLERVTTQLGCEQNHTDKRQKLTRYPS